MRCSVLISERPSKSQEALDRRAAGRRLLRRCRRRQGAAGFVDTGFEGFAVFSFGSEPPGD